MPSAKNNILPPKPVSAAANGARVGRPRRFYNAQDGETLPAIFAQGLWLTAFLLDTLVFPSRQSKPQAQAKFHPSAARPAPPISRRRLKPSH